MSPGQAAYEKWRDLIDTPKVPGVAPVVREWDRLRPREQEIWEAVAAAARSCRA